MRTETFQSSVCDHGRVLRRARLWRQSERRRRPGGRLIRKWLNAPGKWVTSSLTRAARFSSAERKSITRHRQRGLVAPRQQRGPRVGGARARSKMGDGDGGMWGFEGKRWARSWQSGMERLHGRKREKCFFFFHEPTVEVNTKLKPKKKKKRNLKIRTNYLCLVFKPH